MMFKIDENNTLCAMIQELDEFISSTKSTQLFIQG